MFSNSTSGKDIYSLDEILTNKAWIDGKPIYRRVVEYSWPSNTSSPTLAHGISGISFITDISGIYYRPANSRYLSSPTAANGNNITLSADTTNIYPYTDNVAYLPLTCKFILEYTK